MPNPRRSLQYGQEMWEILREVAVDGMTQEIDLPNPAVARGVRTKFYCFFTALRRDSEAPKAWMEGGDYDKVKEYARMANMVQLAVRGPVLIVRPRDTDPAMQALAKRRTVATGDVAMSSDKMVESLTRLAEKLQGKK
jgi:hypothetical protein